MFATTLNKTRTDKLGDRLRQGNIADVDLRLLDDYRRSFGRAYEIVVGAIRQRLSLAPTGRPAKSTTAIVDKLRRESIRLTQIQDIAGCRLIVADMPEQNHVVDSVKAMFPGAAVVDRRDKSSHGYRAVHVIVSIEGMLVEIQIRTALQHQWAELSEKLSDLLDPSIKYGGGEELVRTLLSKTSQLIAGAENNLARLVGIMKKVDSFASPPESLKIELSEARDRYAHVLQEISDLLAEALVSLDQARSKL